MGEWTEQKKAVIKNFVTHVGGSPWYYRMMNRAPSGNKITLVDEIHFPTHMTPPLVSSINFESFFESGEYWLSNLKRGIRKFPKVLTWEEDAIYIFLSGEGHSFPLLMDGRYKGFDWYSSFCGTHSFGKNQLGVVSTEKSIYAYDQSLARSSCIPDSMTNPPNGDKSLDALINVIAHELIETTSGYDIGNQCVYQYGTIKKLPDGRQYTEKMGDKYYFLQQNFNYKTQTCMSG